MSQGMRFRLLLDGKVHLEEWLDDEREIEAAPVRHAMEAMKYPDKDWLVEVFDPEAPEAEAYVRFGSSPEGMIAPLRFNPEFLL